MILRGWFLIFGHLIKLSFVSSVSGRVFLISFSINDAIFKPASDPRLTPDVVVILKASSGPRFIAEHLESWLQLGFPSVAEADHWSAFPCPAG